MRRRAVGKVKALSRGETRRPDRTEFPARQMDNDFIDGYGWLEARMNEKQRLAAAELLAGWLDKASVGCLLVGMFQPEHMFGGLIGSIICFLIALVIKIRSAR